jgi:hypothetical protein
MYCMWVQNVGICSFTAMKKRQASLKIFLIIDFLITKAGSVSMHFLDAGLKKWKDFQLE